MSEAYHDQIHTDTLRLRLLLTNHCQQNCPHCLNEYMCKPMNEQSVLFMNRQVLQNVVSAYDTVLRTKLEAPSSIHSMKRKIYLSGGEPSLHPDFKNIVDDISSFCFTDCVMDTKPLELTLCSNGYKWDTWIANGTYDKIDHLHFSFGFMQSTLVLPYFIPIWEDLRDWRKSHSKKNIVFSVVTNNNNDFERILIDMLQYQQDTDYGFTVKLWGDLRFSQDHPINKRYAALLKAYPELIHRGPMQHPVNRGIGCDHCTRTCPTLKALWVRPDNTCSPCPQDTQWGRMMMGTDTVDSVNEMTFWVRKALKFHFQYGRTEENN